MFNITNGSVSRTFKPGDYEGRTVTLSFTIEADTVSEADTAIGMVATLAEKHARRTPQPADLVEPAAMVGVSEHDLPAPATVAAKPGRKRASPPPEQPVEAVPTAEAASPKDASASESVATTVLDPFAQGATLAAAPVVATVENAASAVVSSDGPVSTDPRLTDKALGEACAAKVGNAPEGDPRTVITAAVRALRQEFTNSPTLGVAAIPADKRAEFLARLAAI